MTAAHCLSRTWLAETENDSVRLRRPSDGALIELEGLEPSVMQELWAALAKPTSDVELEQLFEPFAELLPVFLEEGILRSCAERGELVIEGGGLLRELIDELVAEAAWNLPPLVCLNGADAFHLGAQPDMVAVSLVTNAVVAMRLGCASCLVLRALGAVGAPGSEQTAALEAPPPVERGDLRALVAAALVELERGDLSAFEGLLVRHEAGLARGRVPRHPDCPCRAASVRDLGPPWLQAELERDGQPATMERIRTIFGDSPFAPLVVGEVAPQPGAFPFDEPYVSGDTRLSRRHRGRVFCTSIPGIVHGSASTAEHSRLLAWSEGVERLAAQGAVFDLRLPASDPRVLETCRLYGWRPAEIAKKTAFCLGLDLLRGVECLVPFGRVAVALPPPICPDGIPVESTFTGAASHVTSLQAILHGSVELLKRDAFIVAWYRQRRLARVTLPRELPADIAERLAYLERHGLRVELHDLRADLPLPMLLADVRATRRVGQWPEGGAILVPAGGFTPLDALRHVVTLICTRFVGLGLDDSPERNPLDAAAVAELGKRIPFWPPLARYLDPARTGALAFLRGDSTVPLEALDADVSEAPRERFRLLGRWMREASLSWIAVPLSDPDVIEAGLRVTKVVVPEAVRMTLDHEDVDRDQPRFLREFPGARKGSWNPDPHPVY